MFGRPKQLLSMLFLVLALSAAFASRGSAVVKDSDADGLTDQAETEVYGTDPLNPDTDGDLISDSDEILNGTNPTDKASFPVQATTQEINQNVSFAWYIGRASGILAFILLTLVVANGLLMTTRLVFRLLPPALNYEIHRFFSWMAFLAVIGHIASFTFDSYFRLTWREGLIPFTLIRDFTSSLGYDFRFAVGIGTVSLYAIAALIISSELKGKGVSLKQWRLLHYTSFLAYLLFLAHGILSGTDSKEWWMIWIYGISAVIVFSLTGLRIYAVIQKKSAPPMPLPGQPEEPTQSSPVIENAP